MRLINLEVSAITTDLTALTNKINELLSEKPQVIIAIDGNCTAGKTTLAAHLGNIYNCNIFHMDDFFLTPPLITKERLSTPGGNIDYERFRDEVLLPLASCKTFNYKPYDCHSRALADSIYIHPKPLNIVEGTYSMHPQLAGVYALSVFLHVEPDLQRARILERDSSLHENFFQKWIPMEELYFKKCRVKERCGIFIDTLNLKER